MMNILIRKLNTLRHNPILLWENILYILSPIVPDVLYLKLLYSCKMRTSLHLENPRCFTEKLQWLKLYNRENIYSILVDKYTVKEFVGEKIGEEYIIPTIGCWDEPDQIDFKSLPSQFVLKTTHGGGSSGVIVCRDKSKLNIKSTISTLSHAMGQDNYHKYREWPYKNIRKRIIAEKFMQNDNDEDLKDYKFYCFNGNPLYCQVISNRFNDETIDFYDQNWELQSFTGLAPDAKQSKSILERPICYDEMLAIARKLSFSIPFVRVDLYQINGKVFFGELTFYPRAGFGTFSPKDWNIKLGQLINLPKAY